jgi:hypothetical protein
MTRALAVLLGSIVLGGAAPAAHRTLHHPAHRTLPRLALQAPLPLPPPLPANPPTDLAAPVPDDDSGAAEMLSAGKAGAAWALRVYPMPDFDTGAGYLPGSDYQSPEQRKPLQTPGFSVTWPLQ